jgi:hypothetical protein
MGEVGHIVWPSASEPIWEFDWQLADSPDAEGIVISRASYRGHSVLYKASLPSLRVRYNGACGPYKIPLNYDHVLPSEKCPGSRVCIYSFVWENLGGSWRGLSLEALYGGYRILLGPGPGQLHHLYKVEQRWTFWDDGQVNPGFNAMRFNHCHDLDRFHVYWRLDFDIDTPGNNLALEYNSYTGDLGWGNGWQPLTSEISRLQGPHTGPVWRSWMVLNKASGRGYIIWPGDYDGTGASDPFSNRDIWVVRYRASEDRHGNQGDAHTDGLEEYLGGPSGIETGPYRTRESIDGQDVVVWYCRHDDTVPSYGWWGGPSLLPHGNWA